MRRLLIVTLIIVIASALQGCDQNKELPEPAKDQPIASSDGSISNDAKNTPVRHEHACDPPMSEGVELTIQVVGGETGWPAIKGETNLPPETHLTVRVSSKSGFSDTIEISAGECSYAAGPFSNQGKPLPDGGYQVAVAVSPVDTQAESVKEILSAGDAILNSSAVGDVKRFQGITTTGSFEVARESAIQEQQERDRAHASKIWSIYEEIAVLLHDGQSMERLRNTDDPDKLRKCGSKMRRYQARAKELRARTQKVPISRYSAALMTAATRLNRCVSCARNANRACGDVKQELDIARKAMPEKPEA